MNKLRQWDLRDVQEVRSGPSGGQSEAQEGEAGQPFSHEFATCNRMGREDTVMVDDDPYRGG